jgi:hypothetical protein
MAGRVPGERRYAVAHPVSVTFQHLRASEGSCADLDIGGAHDRPLDRARHDLAPAMLASGMIDDLAAKQRPWLHQSEHVYPPICLDGYFVVYGPFVQHAFFCFGTALYNCAGSCFSRHNPAILNFDRTGGRA